MKDQILARLRAAKSDGVTDLDLADEFKVTRDEINQILGELSYEKLVVCHSEDVTFTLCWATEFVPQ